LNHTSSQSETHSSHQPFRIAGSSSLGVPPGLFNAVR
jgi:hypothetical protein